MLIELKSLYDMPIGALSESKAVGTVLSPIIDPQEKKMVALMVETGQFFSRARFVSIEDVVDIDKNGVVVNSEDSLVNQEEIVKLAKLIKAKFSLLNLRVITREGKRIGFLHDALIDSLTGDILRIYVNHFASRRIFERSQIISINQKNVIVKKDLQDIKESAVESSAIGEVNIAQ